MNIERALLCYEPDKVLSKVLMLLREDRWTYRINEDEQISWKSDYKDEALFTLRNRTEKGLPLYSW